MKEFDDPLEIMRFFELLEGPDGCDFKHDEDGKLTWRCKGGMDQSLARTILRSMEVEPDAAERFLDRCRELGGHCDCEILFNASDQIIARN